MKNIALSIVAILFTMVATAQEQVTLTKQEKKALRQEQKRQSEIILSRNTSEALRTGRFVLKADQLRGRGGYVMHVNPTINFVAVEGDEAYVQVASATGIGFNGLGGVTLRGKITSFELEQGDKHGSYNIMMNTMGTGGNLTIVMNINKTGEMASASVHTNYGSRVEMNGVLVPWTGTGSKIYKGRETF